MNSSLTNSIIAPTARRLSGVRRALISIAALLVIALSWCPAIDRNAGAQVSSNLVRAAKVFAMARGAGAALSVAQSVEVDVKFLGTGVGVSLGQALRPAQEYVDRFAALMLAATVAFGIQALLVEIGGHWAVAAMLSVSIGVTVLAVLIHRWRPSRPVQALLLLLLMVRFAVPVSVLAEGLVYRAVMAPQYEVAVTALEESGVRAEAEQDGSVLGKVKSWFNRIPDTRATIDNLVKSVHKWADWLVRLLALFAVQTVVLPILFLWVFWRVCRYSLDAFGTSMPHLGSPSAGFLNT